MFICNLSPKTKPCENHRLQMFPKWEKCQCKKPLEISLLSSVWCHPLPQPARSTQLWACCSSAVQFKPALKPSCVVPIAHLQPCTLTMFFFFLLLVFPQLMQGRVRP